MIPNKYKLILLGSSFLGCLSTLFTSTSFDIERQNLRDSLAVPLNKVCGDVLSKAKVCKGREKEKGGAPASERREEKGGDKEDCNEIQEDVNSCIAAANAAYKQINMGTCLKKIRSYQFCKAEWCVNEHVSVLDMRRNLGEKSSKDDTVIRTSAGGQLRKDKVAVVGAASALVGGGGETNLCQQHCHAMKKTLTQCEDRVVQRTFSSWGIDSNHI